MQLKLISFTLCPFVQRAVITLNWKNIPFEIEYIDLKNKPDWFLKLSPLGKVPVLIINGRDVIFESNVINELADELNPPISLSANPVEKARERAWIIYADSLFSDLYMGCMGNSETHFGNLVNKLARLDDVISDSGHFKNGGFSIIDSSYAPLFFRMQYIEYFMDNKTFNGLKKVQKWQDNLLSLECVKKSVVKDFESQYREYIKAHNPELQLQPQMCMMK